MFGYFYVIFCVRVVFGFMIIYVHGSSRNIAFPICILIVISCDYSILIEHSRVDKSSLRMIHRNRFQQGQFRRKKMTITIKIITIWLTLRI